LIVYIRNTKEFRTLQKLHILARCTKPLRGSFPTRTL
jgi:hypothetical protein